MATGHAYVAGGALSELSERKIQQGNQQALPATLFPEGLAYVAMWFGIAIPVGWFVGIVVNPGRYREAVRQTPKLDEAEPKGQI